MDGYGPATYGDGFAEVYDDWYGERDDVDAVVGRLRSVLAEAGGGPVLELGIGTGRLALPLAASGAEVWGVDASVAMVERLRAKAGGAAIRVAVTDMAALDLRGVEGGADVRFGLVFVAANTFFNLTTEDAQRRCLGRVAERLRPGGRFLVEAFVPSTDGPRSSVDVGVLTTDRVVLRVSRHDPATQIASGQHVELTEDGGVRLRPWMIRYATPAQLDAMAAEAGLVLVDRWSGWDGAPFTDDDNGHISVYAPAGGAGGSVDDVRQGAGR